MQTHQNQNRKKLLTCRSFHHCQVYCCVGAMKNRHRFGTFLRNEKLWQNMKFFPFRKDQGEKSSLKKELLRLV